MNDTIRKIVLAGFAVVLTLVLAEVTLRVVGFGEVAPEMGFGVNTRAALEQGRFEPDPDLFWKLPARQTMADRDMKAVHPDLEPPARRARLRILVLGDSCSRLSMKTLPYSALLEDRLRSDGYEVLNASVPGYTTYQGLTWLRTQLLALEPDIVVVYFGWNDHWRATGVTDRQYAASRSGLRLLQLGKRLPDLPPLRVPLEDYRENLETIVNEVQGIGATVVLVAAPHHFTQEAAHRLVQTRYILAGENPRALHEEYLAVVRGFAGRDGVAVLGADRLFAAVQGETPLMMRDGIHLTDEAHQVMAAALAALVRDGIGGDGEVSEDMIHDAQGTMK